MLLQRLLDRKRQIIKSGDQTLAFTLEAKGYTDFINEAKC